VIFKNRLQRTALVGSFEDGVMSAARPSTVEAVSKDPDSILAVKEYSEPSGPALRFSKSSKTSMGENLLVKAS
jgi:hypothetical protein